MSGDRGAVLRVNGLPLPPAGGVYEVWVKRGASVSPASLFEVTRDGSGAAAVPDDLEGADAVLVTRERRGGAQMPTEPPVITVRVRA